LERSREDRREPASEVERRVAGIWAGLLHVGELDLRDSFLQLGGDSLLIGRAVGRVNAAFGIEVSIQRLFDAPTLAEFAAAVTEELARSQDHRRPPPSGGSEPGTEPLLERIDAMTDDEVQALLAQVQAEQEG
jgi:acyl carrier protein